MRRDPPIAIHLRASWRLTLLLGVAAGAAILSLWPLALPLPVKIVLGAAVAAGFLLHLWRDALRRLPGSVVTVELADDGCVLTDRAGRVRRGTLRGDSFVSSFLTVVNCRLPGRPRRVSVVILPDAADAEEFRRLRVWLRWKGGRGERRRV